MLSKIFSAIFVHMSFLIFYSINRQIIKIPQCNQRKLDTTLFNGRIGDRILIVALFQLTDCIHIFRLFNSMFIIGGVRFKSLDQLFCCRWGGLCVTALGDGLQSQMWYRYAHVCDSNM